MPEPCENCGEVYWIWILRTEDGHEVRMCKRCAHVHSVTCPLITDVDRKTSNVCG